MGTGLSSSISALKVSTNKSENLPDSWDDESSSEPTTPTADPKSKKQHPSIPALAEPPTPTTSGAGAGARAPPPTPASPHHPFDLPGANPSFYSLSGAPPSSPGPRDDPSRRPDKTTAAASRMIAAGLGVRPPKRTEEEREYDKAAKERERKRKDEERRREEEEEKKRAAVWEN